MRAAFRLSRAAVVTAATVLLAVAAHTAAGGALPDPLILLGLLALTLLPTAWLSGKRLTPTTVLGLLGAGQFVLHSAFDCLSESAASLQLSPAAGHVHVLGAASPGAPVGHVHGYSPEMFAAHALATLAIGLLIARGEAALWALLAWLSPLVRLLLVRALAPAAALPAYAPKAFPKIWRGLRLPALRGPPASAAAC
ncbi:hypothetical protein [Sinomonas atrocyanea]